jgi:hypothetical protein
MNSVVNAGQVRRKSPPSAARLMNGTNPLFATLAVLLLGGCGDESYKPMPMGCWAVAPSSPTPGLALTASAAKSDDVWATTTFAVYGNDAVQTCLAAFHQDLVKGEFDTGVPAKPPSYRTQLAEFMCACARGQSAEACPGVLAE